jgi:hypothetical protein
VGGRPLAVPVGPLTPVVASRDHLTHMQYLVTQCWAEAGGKATTLGPGPLGCGASHDNILGANTNLIVLGRLHGSNKVLRAGPLLLVGDIFPSLAAIPGITFHWHTPPHLLQARLFHKLGAGATGKQCLARSGLHHTQPHNM